MSVVEPVLPPLANPADDGPAGVSAIRKATLRLIPLIGLGYGVAYIDRVNISFAALQMNRDLHFSAAVYGFGAGLFFVSYALCEVPSNLMLHRFGARRWLARIMLTWGLIAIAMMFVKTPLQFYIMRFLLGLAEAGFFPGVIYYLTLWFPYGIRARAISRFYIAMPISTVFMGIIAGALLNLQGKLNLAGWQWLFLVEGIPAILLSIVFLLCIPDGPADAKWLTPEEHAWLASQLQQEQLPGSHGENIGRALADPRVWILSLLFLCNLTCNYAYILTAPAILQSITTLSPANIGYLVALMNLLGAPAMMLNAMHSDRTRERRWHVAVPFLLMCAGFLVSGLSHSPVLVVFGLATTALCFFGMQGPLWSIPGTFLNGKSAAAGIAAMNMIGMIGGFIGPYGMGLSKTFAGSYQPGLLLLTIPSLAGALIILFAVRQTHLSTHST